VIYKCWFFTLKKRNNTTEATQIFMDFLLPSYVKSDRFKERANTFSVILRSQNINFNDLKNKIDKYTEKFLKNLEKVLTDEIRNFLPTELSKVNLSMKNYCKNKHQKILQKIDVSDDDSCLSEIEDEIMKTCQTLKEGNNNKTAKVKSDIFFIKKEVKEEINSQGSLSCLGSQKETTIGAESSFNFSDGLSGFKDFIEVSQQDSVYKPLLYINDHREMDIDSDCNMISVRPVHNSNTINTIIDPKLDPSSNWNYYSRKFIPPVNKAKDRLKDKVPFLRDFNPKFLKKENIDKKILRKFRNYVKVIYKDSRDQLVPFDIDFWKDFSNLNLLPPMRYTDVYAEIEFKSFNINYMLWLFSKSGTVELYREFAGKLGHDLLQSFIDAYDLLNTSEEGIVDKLKFYIHNIHEIYADKTRKRSFENGSLYNFSITTQLQSEDVLEHYLGDFQNNNTFRLNNFETILYPRCGKKFTEEQNEGAFNFDMNCSMDSIQSVE
jgi:hypothetical protein